MEMGFPCDGLVAVETQPRLSYVPESTNPDRGHGCPPLLSRYTLLRWQSRGEEIPLTAGKIVHRTVRHVDGASIELVLRWDIRNASHDFLLQRLAITVAREESYRLPYRSEVVYILGNGPGKNILCTRRSGLR
jgi:hypothetical protein